MWIRRILEFNVEARNRVTPDSVSLALPTATGVTDTRLTSSQAWTFLFWSSPALWALAKRPSPTKCACNYGTRGVSCVLVDDEFAHFHPRPAVDPTGRQTSTRALANLWDVNREAGIERLLLASVIESPADVDRIREAVPGADIQIFWLVASYSTLAERIRARQVPTALEWCLQRAQSLIERWQQEPPAHAHVIDASDRSPTEIAAEIVSRSGWLEVRERR